MRKRLILSYFLTLGVCCLTIAGQATTFYVDRNHASAGDANPGTMAGPWQTIQHAAETAVAGDTVFIRTGIYNESIYFDHSGDAVKGPIVFSAYPGEKPVIDGTGVDAGNGLVLDKSYIKLSGWEIRNWNEVGIWVEGGAGYFTISDCEVHQVAYGIGLFDGAHDFELNRVTAHHFDLYGFDVSPSDRASCYNGTFNDCISHTGRDPGQNVDGFALGHGDQHDFVFNRCVTYNVFDGFDISSRKSTLNRCLGYNCWNGAYKLWQDKVLLVNCVGYNCVGSIVELDWGGQPTTTTLMNCTLFDGKTYGIWIENKADTLQMYNCIIAGGDNIGLAFEQMGVGNYRGDYNLFHNDALRAVAVAYTDEFSLDDMAAGKWSAYSKQDAHSIVVTSDAAIFVNPAQYDLHLMQTSPAVDLGTGVDAPAQDFDDLPRPTDSGIDIGAYEYQVVGKVDSYGENGQQPETIHLEQNYPNPFNGSTVIRFTLEIATDVSVAVFNTTGQLVRNLQQEQQTPGTYRLSWDGRDENNHIVESGLYFFRLAAGPFNRTVKALHVK